MVVANSQLAGSSLGAQFRQMYGTDCRIFRAPGRVNIIGEHTDYNQGFVMPAAIALVTRIAISAVAGRRITLQSGAFSEQAIFNLDDPAGTSDHHWSDYVHGVALMLQASGYPVRGANLLIEGHIPLGSGLSSSAALEVASAMALLGVSGASAPLLKIALLCQRAENEFVGARTGIMDQFASCFGKSGQAIFLDCRSLEHRYLPLPQQAQMMVCNTMVKHALAAGEYNVRRQQCEEGVRILSTVLPNISSLRDITFQQLTRHEALLDETIYKRCRHVVEENRRVERAVEALLDEDLPRMGELMSASHASLRHNYEVSSAELDIMVELTSKHPGVWGSRMMGGGFGGCTISLIDRARSQTITSAVASEYRARTGVESDIYLLSAADGAGEETT